MFNYSYDLYRVCIHHLSDVLPRECNVSMPAVSLYYFGNTSRITTKLYMPVKQTFSILVKTYDENRLCLPLNCSKFASSFADN